MIRAAAASNRNPRPLAGIRVLVLTSGHEALDARVYGREAKSVQELGASVTVVGKLTRGTPDTVEVMAVPPPKNRVARFLLQPWRCLWRARSLRPDIVHFHDAEILAVLPVARLLWPKARFVYDVHEDFSNLMLIRDWLPERVKPLVRSITGFFETSLAKLAHGIVAVTPPLAAKFGHRRRVAALNFPTADFFEKAAECARPASARDYALVHLGTLSRPRATFLAEVIRELGRRRPRDRFLIVGATTETIEFLRNLAPGNCELKGPVSHDEVAAMLGNARVGIDVHPWMQPHLRPALAVKICEYMASGCAVVASSTPVLEDILARADGPLRGIRTIHGGEPAEYAEATERLLARIEAGEDPGAELRRFALIHMNWRDQAGRIERLYRALIDGTECAI